MRDEMHLNKLRYNIGYTDERSKPHRINPILRSEECGLILKAASMASLLFFSFSIGFEVDNLNAIHSPMIARYKTMRCSHHPPPSWITLNISTLSKYHGPSIASHTPWLTNSSSKPVLSPTHLMNLPFLKISHEAC